MATLSRFAAAVALAALLASPAASARDKLLAGDRAHAKVLFRLYCAGCHGDEGAAPTAVGKSLGATLLRDPALIDARTDEQLIKVIRQGGPGPGSPALGKYLSLLDAADLVALLRSPLPSVDDVFTDAAAYTHKKYAIAGSQLTRAEGLAGPIPDEERELVVFSVYGGKPGPLGPKVVDSEDHVGLDELQPSSKLGYLVFGPLPGPKGEAGIVALAISPEFRVVKLVGALGAGDVSKLAAAVVGKGGREAGSRRAFALKTQPEQAKALTRLYARTVEAAALAAKEESDRHLFDPPEVSSKAPPSEQAE